MGYPVRAYVRGHWYHVYSKGQRDEPLFFSPEDRSRYLEYLDEELTRCGGNVGSFCLMTNHCHLLLRMGETPLGDVLRTAHSRYARNFNVRRGTSGHLTQKRPGVKIVLDDSYLKTLVGYIHRNPVEAGIVETVDEYPWSSWPWYLNENCDWIDPKSWRFPPGFRGKGTVHAFLEAIGRENLELPGEERFVGTRDQWNRFRERRQEGREAQGYQEQRDRRSLDDIIQKISDDQELSVKTLRGPSRDRFVSKVRQKAMALMYYEGHSVSDIARFFNRTPTAVTQAHKKWGDVRGSQ